MMNTNIDYVALQISDLHIFANTDWNIMRTAYAKLPYKDKIQLILVTGDLHSFGKDYTNTIEFLNKLLEFFHLTKRDIYIVPGNHDSNMCDDKEAYTFYIDRHIEDDPDCYKQYFVPGKLMDCFCQYNEFIANFYGDEIIYDHPEQVQVKTWNNKLNLIHLNTAINSHKNSTSKQVVDIKKVSELTDSINKSIPSIILAHHPINRLPDSQKKQLVRIITDLKVSAYLCGDVHKEHYFPVQTLSSSGSNIPCIVCGKSAPETGDTYSDLGCILYVKEYEKNTMTVHPFEWSNSNKSFMESHMFHNDMGLLSFELYKEYPIFISRNTPHNTNYLEKSESIWLPDAEKATGTQSRFASFTLTSSIDDFLKEKSDYWGISAVKGIGKTFVLQVKRRNIAKDKLCLPIGVNPSIENTWGTESVILDDIFELSSIKVFENVKILWKFSIIVYSVNQIINIKYLLRNKKEVDTRVVKVLKDKIVDFFEKSRISSETFELCTSNDYSSLDKIIKHILTLDHWTSIIKKDIISLLLLQNSLKDVLGILEKRSIVLFIDKIDQALKQVNSEPPVDCDECYKQKTIINCLNHLKSTEYCTKETTYCRKDCCYGCEKYETPYSDTNLRIHEKRNKYQHINIWQYLQLGLLKAVYEIKNEFKGVIEIYFTIREEAFSCEITLLGEHSNKVASLRRQLWYTKSEQQQIFYDCIKNQHKELLFNANLLESGRYEEAFVGVSKLCHPYAKSLSESVFDSIYRHSFDRSRDIQEYGEYLTNHIEEIRACQNEFERGEKVKKLIEDRAAELAFYIGNEQSSVNKSYYVEKIPLLPNFWAEADNFKKLILMMPKNLMFAKEAKNICKKFNGVAKCKKNCQSCFAQYRPFSMLYKLGMLGTITNFHEWNKDIEPNFLHAKQITYITFSESIDLNEDTIYVLHPALTKSIEKLGKKVMHFNGFIIGKSQKIKFAQLSALIDDYKSLSADGYQKKYFYEKP